MTWSACAALIAGLAFVSTASAQTIIPARSFSFAAVSNQPCTGADEKISFADASNGNVGVMIGYAVGVYNPGGGNWPTVNGMPITQGGQPTDFFIRSVGVNLFVNGNMSGQVHVFVGHGSPSEQYGDQLTPTYAATVWVGSDGTPTANPVNAPVVSYPADAAQLFNYQTDYLDVHVGCPAGDVVNAAWLTVGWVPTSQ